MSEPTLLEQVRQEAQARAAASIDAPVGVQEDVGQRFEFPVHERPDAPQLQRPPEPSREMAGNRGSPDDAAEHQRRTWVRNEDSQLADAFNYRKQMLAHQRLLAERAREHASLEQGKYDQLATETEQALARWNHFRRSNRDVLPEPANV